MVQPIMCKLSYRGKAIAKMKEKIQNYLLPGLASLWGVLLPVKPLLYGTIAIVFIDLITGIWKAIKIKEKITSRRMRETIGKLAIYLLVILGGFAADNMASDGAPAIAKVLAGAIALVEIKSVAENASKILGYDLWTMVVAKLKPKPTDNSNNTDSQS